MSAPKKEAPEIFKTLRNSGKYYYVTTIGQQHIVERNHYEDWCREFNKLNFIKENPIGYYHKTFDEDIDGKIVHTYAEYRTIGDLMKIYNSAPKKCGFLSIALWKGIFVVTPTMIYSYNARRILSMDSCLFFPHDINLDTIES